MKIKNLPKTIYLQIGGDCDHDDWNKIYPSHEVTWCVDKINNNDIVYRLDKRRLNEPKARSVACGHCKDCKYLHTEDAANGEDLHLCDNPGFRLWNLTNCDIDITEFGCTYFESKSV